MKKDNSNETYTADLGDDKDKKIIVGDSMLSQNFHACVQMGFWDEDQIILRHDGVGGTPTFQDGEISLSTPFGSEEWSQDEEGLNLKWLFKFDQKPATNKYSLKLEGNWQDFDFIYQEPFPSPTSEMIDGEEWLTQVWPGAAGDISTRHRKIDGSTAVYHKTKCHHAKGGTNYRNGKAFHIFVPKAIDSEGKFEWCTLSIVDGIYTVTIPQSFLDTAVYPVTVNDEFGYQTITGTEGTFGNDQLYLLAIGTMPEAGTLDKVLIYDHDSSANANIRFGLYSDDGDGSWTLIFASGDFSGPALDHWEEAAAGSEVLGNGLWIASALQTEHDSDISGVYDAGGGTYSRWSKAFTPYAAMPADPDSFSELDRRYATYIEYTPTAAGNAGIMTTNTGYWGPTF
ncbi:MAG: hypothetical protein ACXABY_02805 [Candidatus Thorarchaeota archaeon]|jgi:hypothetical protein